MQDRALAYAGSDGCLLYVSVQGEGPLVVLLHGGGPDHRSLLSLAARLADDYTVALPDVRGYGRSRCADPARHTWDQYATDVVSLIDALQTDRAETVRALIVVSIEEIEDDQAKAAETALMDDFAEVVRARGVAAGTGPFVTWRSSRASRGRP